MLAHFVTWWIIVTFVSSCVNSRLSAWLCALNLRISEMNWILMWTHGQQHYYHISGLYLANPFTVVISNSLVMTEWLGSSACNQVSNDLSGTADSYMKDNRNTCSWQTSPPPAQHMKPHHIRELWIIPTTPENIFTVTHHIPYWCGVWVSADWWHI